MSHGASVPHIVHRAWDLRGRARGLTRCHALLEHSPPSEAPEIAMSQFNAPHFQSPEAARTYLEALRWGQDRVCPHCGTVNESFATKKAGVYRCRSKECRKDFSVTTKSVMESSHIKLNVWLQAFFLMSSSKKGMSSHQLHRALGITYKSAWFLTHRIREAMRSGGLLPPMGGAGKTVEADETFIGKNAFSPKGRKKPSVAFRNIVLTLVERGGSARSFPIDTHTLTEITAIVRANVHHETAMNTDEGSWYNELGEHFARHETVHHKSDEYVHGDVTTNTVEGYYSIFKRRMKRRLSALLREAPSPLPFRI
jgi:transposase-like protein